VFKDNSMTYGWYHRDQRVCRAYAGANSDWGVAAGADGQGLGRESYHPKNTLLWMAYGPFSLQGASAGDLGFQVWLNSEVIYDGGFDGPRSTAMTSMGHG
jgi:hypothetical protein